MQTPEPRDREPQEGGMRESTGVIGWWKRRTEMQKLGVFALIFLVFLGGRALLATDEPAGTEEAVDGPVAEETVPSTEQLPLSTYQQDARSVPYERLDANPGAYEGELLEVSGRVLEAEAAQGITVMRIAMAQGNGDYEEEDYVVVGYGGDTEISEGDVLTVWGDGLGGFEHDGRIVPSILGKYVSIE